MVNSKENRNKIVKLVVCLAVIFGVFFAAAMPVAASNVFSKNVKKAAGVWIGSAKHASTFVSINYSCKRGINQSVPGFRDSCTDRCALGNHRARIHNSKGTVYAKKKSQGINTSISKMHYGKSTDFQSEYHMK